MKPWLKAMGIGGFIVLFALVAPCGGGGGGDDGGGGTTFDSATAVDDLVNLEAMVTAGTLSSDEFLAQYAAILAEIDGTSGGVEALQAYLEENVLGFAFATSVSADKASMWDSILNSAAYQMLENFLHQVIFSTAVEPAASIVQVANSQTFIVLSMVQVRTHIHNAQFSGQISVDDMQNLLEVNKTNPYEAERQLMQLLGLSIPAWLSGAPDTCQYNCSSTTGTYTGSFDATAQFSRVFPETTCTWTNHFTGTVSFALTVSIAGAVSGTATASGSGTYTTVSGSIPGFTCLEGTHAINSSPSASGTISSMTWTGDMGDGIFPAVFTGRLEGTQVIGQYAVTYSNGSGSVTIPVTLTKTGG